MKFFYTDYNFTTKKHAPPYPYGISSSQIHNTI